MATKRTTFSESNINIANNTSSLTIQIYFSAQNSTTWFQSSTLYCTCNGIQKSQTVTHPRGGSVNASFTFDNIKHNDDGTKSVSWNWSCTTGTAGLGTQSDSGTKVLTTIPRASSVELSDNVIGHTTKIKIKRASTSFKHTLSYEFGTLSGEIATDVESEFDWVIPDDFYYEKDLENSPKANLKITCITYNGTSKVGEKQQDFEIVCSEGECIPDLGGNISDINDVTYNLTKNHIKLIKYVSTARIEPIASAKKGATIKSITVDGVEVKDGHLDIEKVSTNSFNIAATDSRGFSKSITVTTEMIDYLQLTCNATIKRTSQIDGIVKLDYSGNYFNGSFGDTENALSISWSYREKGSSEWITLGDLTPTFTGNTYKGSITSEDLFDYQKDYEFIIYVSDKLNKADINNISTYKTIPPFSIYENGILVNGKTLEEIVNNLILERDKKKYHVGKLVLETSGINPAEYLGFGEWILWGAGRVPVGVDLEQEEFNEVEKIGGEKTHKLTEAEVPKHRHGITTWHEWNGAGSNNNEISRSNNDYNVDTQIKTDYAGGDQPHNNLQPYITCYMWKRIA